MRQRDRQKFDSDQVKRNIVPVKYEIDSIKDSVDWIYSAVGDKN